MRTTTIHLAAIALTALSLATLAARAETGPIDANGDGVLDRDEFAVIETLGASWVVFDANQDGVISQIEFNQEAENLATRDGTPRSLDVVEARRRDELTAAFSNPTEY